MVHYSLNKHIAILALDNKENKFNPKFIKAILDKLKEIENTTDAQTLIVRSTHNKIFSNGIDLDWLIPLIKSKNFSEVKNFLYLLNKLFEKILTYPLITIACINGHSFAGGAIMSCAFDFRFMRSDRGFFCLPEIDLGIPFLPGMNAILKKSIPLPFLEFLQYSGARLTGEDCKKYNIVTQIYNNDLLLEKTIEFAMNFKKNRKIIEEIKKRLNKSIIKIIQKEDPKYIETGILILN